MGGGTAIFANAKGCRRMEAEVQAPPDVEEETVSLWPVKASPYAAVGSAKRDCRRYPPQL
jgi:hypothetical protein